MKGRRNIFAWMLKQWWLGMLLRLPIVRGRWQLALRYTPALA